MAQSRKVTSTSPLKPCSHGVKSENGYAYHATWCREFRSLNGIPDNAPGVRQSRDKAEPTLAGVLERMAARGSVVQSAPAGETIRIGDVTYRKA